MVDLQQVIDESRPMLEDFLCKIGIYQPGERIADVQLLEWFSDWIDEQEFAEADYYHLASRIAAFICEYLIEGHSAIRFIKGRKIILRQPIDRSQGVYRDFEPYSVALGLIKNRKSLKIFLYDLQI